MLPIESSVFLQKALSERIQEGHPWIYKDALLPHKALPDGTIVNVLDPQGGFLARGIYDATSPIAVRIYSLDSAESLNSIFREKRLRQAFALRLPFFPCADTNAFRLCHGEGDFIPGLIVDIYQDTAVVQFDGNGVRQFWVPDFPKFLLAAAPSLSLQRIYLKERHGQGGQVLWGDGPPEEIQIREHGIQFYVNVIHGQKTGFFLDQRENRFLIRSIAKGRRVWNGFCYTGGFSIQAALGGATRVVSVDTAAPALATARRNFQLNSLPMENHAFFAQDVFVNLRQAIASALRYDLVIVDPPSFAHSKDSVPRALRAYRELFAQAIRIVEKGGILAASSCSSHVDQETFLRVLGQAAAEVQRPLRFLEIRGQPSDHPSLPNFPEGRYLKFVLAQLD